MGAGRTRNGEKRKEICGSMRVEGKNPKSVWWNYEIKTAVRRTEAAWMDVLAVNDEEAKER